METLYNLGWRREVFICDDNFIGNQTHARAILKKLIPWMQSHGEPFGFWTQASANLGQICRLVDLLTAANFGNVFIGVESPDEAVLVGNRKYQNVKNPLGQSLTNIRANGLGVLASFIMGFDQETKGAGDRICAFVEQHNLPVVMVNLLQALPNTALWDRLKQENRLLGTGVSADMIEWSFNFLPARPPARSPQSTSGRWTTCTSPPNFWPGPTGHPGHEADPAPPPGSVKARSPATRKAIYRLQGRCKDLMALLKLIWRQGVVAGYRRQFWRQLVGVYRQNPSRLHKYLEKCGMGENLFQIRASLLAQAGRPGPDKIRRLNRGSLDGAGGRRRQLAESAASQLTDVGSDHRSPARGLLAARIPARPFCHKIVSILLFIYYKNVSNEEKKFTGQNPAIALKFNKSTPHRHLRLLPG